MIDASVRKIYNKIAMEEYGHKYSDPILLPWEKEQVRKIALKIIKRNAKKHSKTLGGLSFY